MTDLRVSGLGADERRVATYLPANYRVTGTDAEGRVLVSGEDRHGWTADDYVIPRLASGLMFVERV